MLNYILGNFMVFNLSLRLWGSIKFHIFISSKKLYEILYVSIRLWSRRREGPYCTFSFAALGRLTASATLRYVKCYYGMLGWKILPIGIFRSAKFNKLNSSKKFRNIQDDAKSVSRDWIFRSRGWLIITRDGLWSPDKSDL